MVKVRRRAALLGLMAAVATSATAWAGGLLSEKDRVGSLLVRRRELAEPIADEPITAAIPGGGDWRIDKATTRPASDARLQITGYASATSVNLGQSIDFHVSMREPGTFWVEVYRMGFYGGRGARRMKVSPQLYGVSQAIPKQASTLGSISCSWPASWRLRVPKTWMSGYYLAVFTTSDGYRGYTPFVVRDDAREADLCVVVPFNTYQAYNLWPKNGTGKSLYYGYKNVLQAAGLPMLHKLQFGLRAFEVSFDRPYANNGLPSNWDLDVAFVIWAEQAGYNMVFAGSHDLHEGRIDPKRYKGLVFSGHDEYWSKEMRESITTAVAGGTSLVFLSANNVYWRVRMPPTADGRDGRLVTCYKGEGFDPVPAADRTARWREPSGPNQPEQTLLGVQFNGIVPKPVPLVVREQDHWFWRGTGVVNGDAIPNVVGAEADGLFAGIPCTTPGSQVLLSASPYTAQNGEVRTQNTSLIECDNGAILFTAGSLTWPRALQPEGDRRIQMATATMLDRVVRRIPVATNG